MKLEKIRPGLYRAKIGGESVEFERGIGGVNCTGWDNGAWRIVWENDSSAYDYRTRGDAVRGAVSTVNYLNGGE